MTAHKPDASAFEQGQQAGKDVAGPLVENPFAEGSPQHNNFEVGRRFGATHSKPSARALIADADEEEN